MPLVAEVALSESPADLISLPKQDYPTLEIVASPANPKPLELVGKVILDDSQVMMQMASLPGRIEKIYIKKPGDVVQKGQAVAQILSKELISAIDAFARPNTPASVKQSALNNLAEWNLPFSLLDEMSQLENYRIPVDIPAIGSGIVIERFAHVGDQASNALMGHPTPLFSLADLSTVWIRLSAYESDLAGLQKGQRTKIRVDAFPERDFGGRIIEIGPVMDENSRTMPILVEVANPNLSLRPGMLARGYMDINPSNNSATQIQVPKSAVLWTGKRSVVYVKSMDYDTPVYHYREIRVGEDLGDSYVVLSGLSEGEQLVIAGAFSIDAAAQLAGKHSMMNPPKALPGNTNPY
jgi:Cu(I)/Ag(I) efflux system membrane fusion protein